MVQAATNAVKKRLDMASRALADFLNVSIFGAAGPGKRYAKILGATGEKAGISLLDGLGGSEFKKAPFPTSDAHAAGSPLVKGDYQRELHFTIGMLRVFDAQVIFVSASRCSFLFDSQLVGFAGEQRNARYGPMLQLSCNEQKIHKRGCAPSHLWGVVVVHFGGNPASALPQHLEAFQFGEG